MAAAFGWGCGGEARALAECAGGGAHGWNIDYGRASGCGLALVRLRCVWGLGRVGLWYGWWVVGTLLGPEGVGCVLVCLLRADHRSAGGVPWW